MSKEVKNLPKATPEIAEEYDVLIKKFESCATKWAEGEREAANARVEELRAQYDWFNVEFTDPTTGKKGLKTVTGELVAPALYDDFNEHHSYHFFPHSPVAAIKDGKCGLIKGDGSGQQLCPFKFDSISTIIFSDMFLACWGGVKDHFGIITANGGIICSNILTGYGEPVNGIMTIKSGDKWGVIDTDTHQCVLPEYDDLDMDAEDPVVFIKGDQRGYIIEETGEFVTISQYEADEKYCDSFVISTRV